MDDEEGNGASSTISTNSNWLNKLKPSNKNKVITMKLRNLNYESENTLSNNFANFKIDNNETKLWETHVIESKNNETDILNDNQSIVKYENYDISMISENLEDINHIIGIIIFILEQKYQNHLTENIFLKGDYHSIIPFLLISSKEIHRMVLSDYEINEITHQFNKKASLKRLFTMDYYRIALISFYKGNYIQAYSHFKAAYKLAASNKSFNTNILINFAKWVVFSALNLLFCDGKSLDFHKLKNLKLFESQNDESSESFLLSCCSSRKADKRKINDYNNDIATDQSNYSFNNMQEVYMHKIDNFKLAEEIEKLVPLVKANNQNSLEGWWMQMYISIYCESNPEQKLFKKAEKSFYNSKLCIKKIKEIDDYLSYVAFIERNLIVSDDTSKAEDILVELVLKYKYRLEGYLKYWQVLVKSKNYKKAHSISEIFLKVASDLKFEEDKNFYYFYVLITYAKSSYLIGNIITTINFCQREFISNFLYPSLFYLVLYFLNF